MTILSPPSCSFEPQNISVETFKNLPCGRSFPLSCQLMLPGRGKQEINLKVPFLHLLIFISIGNDTVFFSQTQYSFQRNLMMLWINWLSHTCTYMHTYINTKTNKQKKRNKKNYVKTYRYLTSSANWEPHPLPEISEYSHVFQILLAFFLHYQRIMNLKQARKITRLSKH